jgi:hypothetical protein
MKHSAQLTQNDTRKVLLQTIRERYQNELNDAELDVENSGLLEDELPDTENWTYWKIRPPPKRKKEVKDGRTDKYIEDKATLGKVKIKILINIRMYNLLFPYILYRLSLTAVKLILFHKLLYSPTISLGVSNSSNGIIETSEYQDTILSSCCV